MPYLIEIWNSYPLPVFIYLIVASISVGMNFDLSNAFEEISYALVVIATFVAVFCIGYYLERFTISVMFETNSSFIWLLATMTNLTSLAALYFMPFFLLTVFENENTYYGAPSYMPSALLTFCIGAGSLFAYHEFTLSPEMKIARAEMAFRAEKQALEEAHEADLKEARAEMKIAEIEEKRRALYGDKSNEQEHQKKLAQLRERASQLQAKGVDYSSLSHMSKSEHKPQEPIDGQFQLILSALWLGACFFLQRIFEKLFHDKGYALLAVCAAGFMLAFFSANYFLLGGSVTGGLMGSTGKSGA